MSSPEINKAIVEGVEKALQRKDVLYLKRKVKGLSLDVKTLKGHYSTSRWVLRALGSAIVNVATFLILLATFLRDGLSFGGAIKEILGIVGG